MKRIIVPLIIFSLLTICFSKTGAQVNQAMIDSLKKRAMQLQQLNNRDLIRRHPDSVLNLVNKYLKFADSTTKQVKNQAVQNAPNGALVQRYLNTQVHTDTVYTTVQLTGYMNVTNSRGTDATTITANCISRSAPMVQKGSTFSILLMSKDLVYGNAAPNINAHTVYGSQGKYVVNQGAIEGSASLNARSEAALHEGGKTVLMPSTTIGAAHGDKMQFVFSYDTLTNVAQVSFMKILELHTIHMYDTVIHGYFVIRSRNETGEGPAGVAAFTDPATWHMEAMSRDAAYSKLDSLTGNKLTATRITDDGKPKPVLIISKTSYGYSMTCDYNNTEDGQTTTVHITAFIGRPIVQYEAIIKPIVPVTDRQCNVYKNWMPKGPKVDGSGDNKTDDSMHFMIIVRDKADTTKTYSNYTVRWMLKEVTHYKGFNTNYPVEDANEEADLKFSKDMRTDIHFEGNVNDSVAITKPLLGYIGIATVSCSDYGAWGKLEAHIKMDDSTELTAYPFYDKSKPYITIPYDEDDNKLADNWEKSELIYHQNYPLSWDDDFKPNNGNTGDNIPLIDEYRGFAVEDASYNPIYKRLSPNQKELFTIAERANEGTNLEYKDDFRLGVKNWQTLTGVTAYHLTQDKYGKKDADAPTEKYGRWVNYNSPLADKKTHGVVLCAEDNFDHKAYATTFPLVNYSRGAQVPDETNYIAFWIKGVWLYDGPTKADPTDASVNIPDDYTINALKWFKPASTGGNWNNIVNNHIAHANSIFYVHMDPNNLSTVAQSSFTKRMHQFATMNVSHELCHATNIAHHGNNGGAGGLEGFFAGDANCPVRYFLWVTNDATYPNCADWVMMFEGNQWNVASGANPAGTPFKLCTTGDMCFYQLKLKK